MKNDFFTSKIAKFHSRFHSLIKNNIGNKNQSAELKTPKIDKQKRKAMLRKIPKMHRKPRNSSQNPKQPPDIPWTFKVIWRRNRPPQPQPVEKMRARLVLILLLVARELFLWSNCECEIGELIFKNWDFFPRPPSIFIVL